ncbi:hypothetical protein JCM33374_g4599 [Metschnikowia sp. JCM 33374]|nr:hypothetical protein JCM33374_g4599 [Metschnikowia sp. JCM 33374]
MFPNHSHSRKTPGTPYVLNYGDASASVPMEILDIPQHHQQSSGVIGGTCIRDMGPSSSLNVASGPQSCGPCADLQPAFVQEDFVPKMEATTHVHSPFQTRVELPRLDTLVRPHTPLIADDLVQYFLDVSARKPVPASGFSNEFATHGVSDSQLTKSDGVVVHSNPVTGSSKSSALPDLECPSDSYTQRKISETAHDAFRRLLPSLKTVYTHHFGEFLLEILNECHDHVPLEDFYVILYKSDLGKEKDVLDSVPSAVNRENTSRDWAKNVTVVHLAVESFKSPETFQNGLLRHSLLTTVNVHEVLRNFLAMKILFGFIKKVDDIALTIPRFSLYKVYYILCQKLIHKYPEISKPLSLEQNLILGRSKFGIVTKLVHPDLIWKRLGKRGQSKIQYIGVAWNHSVVDEHVIRLLGLDMAEIQAYFSKLDQCSEPKYPGVDWSPRVSKTTPNSIPKHSKWAKGIMERSVQALQRQGINLEELFGNINNGIICVDGGDILPESVMHSMYVLLERVSPEESFLHLYLVISVLIFPIILASDQEVSRDCKKQLRASVNKSVIRLEHEVATATCVDKCGLKTFTRILRKMIHISEMTSFSVKKSLTSDVLKEMISDVTRLTNQVGDCRKLSEFEEIFIKGFVKAVSAYGYELAGNSEVENPLADVAMINNVGEYFRELSVMVLRNMRQIILSLDREEIFGSVPYQVFHMSAVLLHEVGLLNPNFFALPISIFNSMMLQHTHVLQNFSFERLAKRNVELVQETFKASFIYSNMCEEYMAVMSEVVALSQTLA